MTLRLEPRTEAPRWFPAVATIGALVVAFIVSGFIIWYARRVDSAWRAVGMGLILGGAAGNLVNRLSGGIDFSGQVVDFIDLHVWPVFNLADSAVVVGSVMLALSLVGKGSDDQRKA